MYIGRYNFDLQNETYIMGILNVTPDSFSDGGRHNEVDKALFHTEKMIREGAHIIDIGGESTRPGYERISDEEEIGRTAPVIEAVRANFDVPISIDTYKSRVAEAALDAGADLINDIWGFLADEKMAQVCAEKKAACCLMHNRNKADYSVYMEDVLEDLRKCVRTAKNAGVEDDRIILDPGVGFGKTYEQNLEIIAKLDMLHCLGYPILLGTSRKSVIGLTLDLPVDQRVEGTIVTSVLAVQKKCAFVRVHDIEANARAIKMTRAILEKAY